MARPLRLEFPYALYHVTSRGNRREAIFVSDSDRKVFLQLLGDVCDRMNWVIHAYCLMDNHFHLLIETPEGNLSKGMRHLNGIYTQKFNHRHQRVGHLFQGRYKAIIVEKNSYLLELARYVILNPVRAGVVEKAEYYFWSSYRAMTGQAESPAWLQTDWLLAQFGPERNQAGKQFICFVHEGKNQPGIWKNLRNQIYLGSEEFIEKIQGTFPGELSLAEIPQRQRRPAAKPLSYYKNHCPDRTHAIGEAYATGHYTQKEIASYFQIHYSTVSKSIQKYQKNRQRKT